MDLYTFRRIFTDQLRGDIPIDGFAFSDDIPACAGLGLGGSRHDLDCSAQKLKFISDAKPIINLSVVIGKVFEFPRY